MVCQQQLFLDEGLAVKVMSGIGRKAGLTCNPHLHMWGWGKDLLELPPNHNKCWNEIKLSTSNLGNRLFDTQILASRRLCSFSDWEDFIIGQFCNEYQVSPNDHIPHITCHAQLVPSETKKEKDFLDFSYLWILTVRTELTILRLNSCSI